MIYGAGQTERQQRIDVKVTIPELTDIGPFWLRDCPNHLTFSELYQDCVNHDEVRRSQQSLARVSRHFWNGERFLKRGETLNALNPQAEISLVLRRDLYRVGPKEAVDGQIEYTYMDAEDRIEKVIPRILNKSERSCCFDLCDWRGRRLTADESLAFHSLWPAWEEAKNFPERAYLHLRPRIGWLAYALLVVAALAGLGLGYWLWIVLAHHSVA
ncbi:MAG: hypothetical protein ACRYFS_01525 [Janthinobacterium lividum]